MLKKTGAHIARLLLAPELRPLEARIARALGLIVLTWLGVKYGA